MKYAHRASNNDDVNLNRCPLRGLFSYFHYASCNDSHTHTHLRTHLRGAILAYVPSGQAMLISVLTTARPPEGTTVFSAEDKSNPAD